MLSKYYPVHYAQETVSTLSVYTLDATIISNYSIDAVYITLEGSDIRFLIDSGATQPTSSIGHLVKKGREILIEDSASIRGFRAIASSSSATIHITYYSSTRR